MAPKKKNKSTTPPPATNRVTTRRSSKRQQRMPPTNPAAQDKAKQNSFPTSRRSLRSSSNHRAAVPASPRVDPTQKRASKRRAAEEETECTPNEQEEEPPIHKRRLDQPSTSPQEESDSEAVSKNFLPAAETAAIVERYNRNILQEQERKNDHDQAILSSAIDNLQDPYLKRVLEVLLQEHKEKQQEKNARYIQQRADVEPIVPRNLNPSPVQYDPQAREFVRCFQAANAMAEERANVPQAIARGSSVVSELTDDMMTSHTRKPLKAFLALHQLQECEEEIAYTLKNPNGTTRRGKRRVRGICRHCKKKTKWFCPTCVSGYGAKRAWYCHERSGSQCQQEHLQKCEDFFHKA